MSDERITDFRVWHAVLSQKTTYVFFELVTSADRIGIGEASMSTDDEATVRLAYRLFEERLSGCSVDAVAPELDRMEASVGSTPTLPLATAFSALEQCIWDLRAQRLGVPLYALLGGARRQQLGLYANINRGIVDRTPEGFAAAASNAVAAGFGSVKCAPFDGVLPSDDVGSANVRAGLERVRSIRDAAPDARLLVDCHGRLSMEVALEVAPRLRALGVCWFEEPVVTHCAMNSVVASRDESFNALGPETQGDDLARLAECGLPVASGEFEYGLTGCRRLWGRMPLSVIMPDVKYCGGVWQSRLIADVAYYNGIRFSLHNPSGPVATVYSMHVCAAVPQCDLLEYQWGEVPDRRNFVVPEEPIDRGVLTCSERPGVGYSLNRGMLTEYV